MNDLIGRFNGYPLGQKVLFMCLLMILMVVAFYFLHYQPYQEEMDKLNNDLAQQQQQLEEFELLKNNRAAVLAELEQRKRELLVAREQLPASAEIPSLLQRVHNLAKIAGLEILVFKRVPDVNRSYYTEIPVEMQLEGNFDQLADFFLAMGRLPRIINVRDITMKKMSGGGNKALEAEGDLMVTARATTFMYNAPDAPVTPAGTPPAR